MRLSARLTAAGAAAALSLLCCASASPASAASSKPTAGPSSPSIGSVTTPDGVTHLTDSAGRVLDLRGFNLDKYDEATRDDIRQIAERGFTLIRLDITWARLEPHQGVYDTAAMNRLQQLMTWADTYGLHVMVDFHQDVYGPYFGGGQDGVPAWATRDDGLPFEPIPGDWFSEYFEPSVQAAFRHLYDDADLRAAQASFYQHIASALRFHPSLLGYDLFNEPSGPMLGDPSDPNVLVASVQALEQDRLPAMYDRLIAAIRRVDQRSWLFVEPTALVGEGVPTALPAFADPRPGSPRIGFAPHFYSTAVEAGQDWDPSDGFVTGYVAAITAYPAAHRMPVIVGEWGPPNADTPGNTALIAAQVKAMSTFATGWTQWYWAKGTGGYSVLDPAGTPHPGDAPVFAPFTSAVAGTPGRASYDAATGTYTTSYTPSHSRRGPAVTEMTEIVLPANVYPDGVRVTVSGAATVITLPPHGPSTAGHVWVFADAHGRDDGAPITVTVQRKGRQR
ncbi:MAG: cellulase family glycosylhydrolase [Catenulispora sp.]|nr:cellulase family glycosylhydrolase [Catenulispora sp.]